VKGVLIGVLWGAEKNGREGEEGRIQVGVKSRKGSIPEKPE